MKSKILVVGDIFIDAFTYGTCDRLAPDFIGLVFDETKQEYYLGGAGNVAKNIASLLPDATVTLMGSIDIDKWGELTTGLRVVNISDETMIKHRYVALGKNKPGMPRSKQKLFRTDNLKRFTHEAANVVTNDYDFIIISDYNKGTVSPNIRIAGSPTILLDSKRKDISGYSFVDIVKINGSEYENCKDTIKNETIIVTNGPDPVDRYTNNYLVSKVDTFDLPIHQGEQYDFSGAGDTFLAGLVYGLSKSIHIDECIKIANIASAIAITQFGTTTVNITDLENTIKLAKINGYM